MFILDLYGRFESIFNADVSFFSCKHNFKETVGRIHLNSV